MCTKSKMQNLDESIIRVVKKFLGRSLNNEQRNTVIQLIKFCFVGVSNTAISLAIYYGFIIADEKLYIVGNMVGFIVSVLNSYYWNSRFVFYKKDMQGKTIAKTFMAYGSTLFLGTGLLYLFVDIFGISVMIPLNFLLNKFWVMK